jgi:rubredoxin-NAD+ reductase
LSAPLVIVGAGLAGFGVARELRKLDTQAPIRLITADDGDFYSKPNLSNALAWGKTPAQLVAAPRAAAAAQWRIDILHGRRVVALDPAAHALRTDDGAVEYGRLVLAVGARPIRLPLAGDGAADVLSVNHLADYAVFRERLEGRRRVAILGAGLIGCEFANDLVQAGFAVDVFDVAPQALPRFLPAAAAAFFARGLEAVGVRWRFATGIMRVDKRRNAYVLTDGDGRDYEADIVLSAVGLKPETGLAAAAGLVTRRGIVVDDILSTSAADVFAVGDCAEVEGRVLPFIEPIAHQTRALAKTLAGAPMPVRYPAMPVIVKTPACPAVVCLPAPGMAGAWREEAVAGGMRATLESADGRTLGFVLVGAAVTEKQALTAQMPAWL